MDECNKIEPMTEEEMAEVILGMEYLEAHPEEFPEIEIVHF